LDLTYTFAPTRGTENFGENAPTSINPITSVSELFELIPPNWKKWIAMKLPINPERFTRIEKGIRPCGAFVFLNFLKKFYYLAP